MSASRRPQYRCANERRRRGWCSEPRTLNGIDVLEVDASQTVLRVLFLHDLPGSGPGAVPAGAAIRWTSTTSSSPAARASAPCEVVGCRDRRPAVLTVTVDRPGDFAPYELRLVDPLADDDVPDGFDTRLARVQFSFKAACASDLDCLPAPCPPPPAAPGRRSTTSPRTTTASAG